MAIPTGAFNHANLQYDKVTSTVAGTSYILQPSAAVRIVGVNLATTTLTLPQVDLSPFGPSIFFVSWNGLGTVTFSIAAGSTNTVNGGAGPVSYLEADFLGVETILLVLALETNYKIIPLRASSASGLPAAVSPNIQINPAAGGSVDGGHELGADRLYLASTAAVADPTSLAAGGILLGDGPAGTFGAGSVTVGNGATAVGVNSVAVGDAGSVGANSVLVGQCPSVLDTAAAVGSFDSVAASGAAVGAATTVGAGSCVLGNATGAVPDGAIFFGNGACSGTAKRINFLDVEPEVANAQANGDDIEFLTVNHNGNTRYIPLTHAAALSGQSDGLNLICMGTNACGGPSGNARVNMAGAAFQSLVIGEDAAANWNATAGLTTEGMTVIGQDALRNLGAGETRVRNVAIGRNCAEGNTATQTGTGCVFVGNGVNREYLPAESNTSIGDLVCRTKPTSVNDFSATRVGSLIQASATAAGGIGLTLFGAGIMQLATCTFEESNNGIMIGRNTARLVSGVCSFNNIFIGGNVLENGVFGGAGITRDNVVIGGSTLDAASATVSGYNVCLGSGSFRGVGAGLGTDDVVIGARTFTANVAPLNNRVVCIGGAQTGVPLANEVMLGYGCAASGVAGRLSFGNAMEAVAAAATAGAAVLPANPVAFMPVNYNGVAYKVPLYNP